MLHTIVNVKIKKLREDAIIPEYAKEGDAGLDLVAIEEPKVENGYIQYSTGLAVEIPKGFVGLLYPRSSISKYDLVLANSVGVIDSGYRGELLVRFKEHVKHGVFGDLIPSTVYQKGDKVAQLMVMPVPQVSFIVCKELNDSTRGEGGFGSTGK